LGFRRGKSTQNENQVLLKIEGVKDRTETRYYMGKRVVYVYKVKNGFRVNKFFLNRKHKKIDLI
jgi:large subunit ribosomal protein L35Ae